MPERAAEGFSLPPVAAVARSLASALDVREVMHRVAEAAVAMTRARGAHVEQVISPDGTVEIVAAAGAGTPPLRTRVPFPGSLTEEMIRGALPVLLTELREIGEGIAPYLVEHCDHCSGMVAPLLAGDSVLGALVLLRSAEQGHFGDDDAAQVRILADLASVSLERLQLLERSQREREQKTALLESTAEGIYGIDREGRCTFVNQAAARMLGHTPEELLGSDMHRLVHHTSPDGAPHSAADCPILRTARTGAAVRADDELLWRGDGTPLPVEYGASPLRERGSIVGAVVTFQDITERKRAEATLRESEERFRFFYEDTPMMYFAVDGEGAILSVNRYGAEYLGYRQEELAGRPVTEIFYDADRARAREMLADCRSRPGEICRWELRKVRQANPPEIVWVRETARTVQRPDGPDGQMVTLIVCEDVTDAKQAEREREQLLESERQARAEAERRAREEAALREATRAVSASASTEEVIRRIAESAAAATDADAAFVERIDIQRGEAAVVAATGGSAPALGSRVPYSGSFAERVVEGARPETILRLGEAARHLPDDLITRCADCSAVVVPLADGGEPIGALLLLRGPDKPPFRPDEVQRAHTFGELAALAFRKIHMLEDSEQRREELQRVMESRARLMRGFSHDVKNPLGAADGFLQLLEDGIMGEIGEKQKQSIGRARRAIGNSLALIDDLLELARAEAGQLEIEHVPVDVRDALREIGEEYRAQAESKGLTLVMRLPDEIPIIDSDATRVRQILGNLLSNAVKYTDQGEVEVSTGLSSSGEADGQRDWIVTCVRDTGPGISADKQRLLFQEFTRLDPGEKKGAGVGLAISQRIAFALGGRISVQSEAGQGSTFMLWLPCTRGEAADVGSAAGGGEPQV